MKGGAPLVSCNGGLALSISLCLTLHLRCPDLILMAQHMARLSIKSISLCPIQQHCAEQPMNLQ